MQTLGQYHSLAENVNTPRSQNTKNEDVFICALPWFICITWPQEVLVPGSACSVDALRLLWGHCLFWFVRLYWSHSLVSEVCILMTKADLTWRVWLGQTSCKTTNENLLRHSSWTPISFPSLILSEDLKVSIVQAFHKLLQSKLDFFLIGHFCFKPTHSR